MVTTTCPITLIASGKRMDRHRSTSLDDMMMDCMSSRLLPPTKVKRQLSLTICTERESCQCGKCKRKKFATRKYESQLCCAQNIPRTSSVVDNWTTTHSQDVYIQIDDSSHENCHMTNMDTETKYNFRKEDTAQDELFFKLRI
jgi:hypothetical protein